MANEQVFHNRVADYVKGRLGYAQEAVTLICDQLLHPGACIADVGSGTGIFAREFIERGYDVFCVEPNENMLRQAQRQFAGNPHFIPIAATAEATTLPDSSVQLVTAAAAFHWFDAEAFHAECRRILTPGGVFFSVSNSRDYNDPFTRRQHELCLQLCPTFTSLRHGLEKSVPHYAAFFGEDLHHMEFDFPMTYQKEQFVYRSLSSSYAPEPGTEAYNAYAEELRALMDEFAPNSDQITIPNITVAYWGKPAE